MRNKRTNNKKAVSFVGYDASAVEETLRLLEKQAAFIDTVMKEERQSFVSLYYQKTMQVEQLQALLQESLDKEDEMMRSRMPL